MLSNQSAGESLRSLKALLGLILLTKMSAVEVFPENLELTNFREELVTIRRDLR